MFSKGKAPGHSPSTSAHNPPPSPFTALETELVTKGGGGAWGKRERNGMCSRTPPAADRREYERWNYKRSMQWFIELNHSLMIWFAWYFAYMHLVYIILNEFLARKWSRIHDSSVIAHIASLHWALLLLPLSITIMCKSAMNNWQQLRPFL